MERAWRHRGALAWLLWPFSLVFGFVAQLRRALYHAGLLHSVRLAVPVMIVGNVIAGGAGKTPVVMALLAHLATRGIRAGVVSRGYGRNSTDCLEVMDGSAPAEVGDEPLLIKQSCRVPVFVAARRALAARSLLQAHPGVQVIVCDDGLQHLALQRDIEVCVFDERGIGNGWLLPAGPLREPWPRAVDLVLRSGTPPGIEGFEVQRALASFAVNAAGTRIFLAQLRDSPVVALAGIGRPEAFFAMLRTQGITPAREIALPDHHDFKDAGGIADAKAILVCTQKDAVKLWRARPDAWAVPLCVRLEPAFWTSLDCLLDAKLSSRDGPQTP